MSGLFRDHHRVSEWEEAVERDGRAELYAVYYVPGKKVLDHASGVVRIGTNGDQPINRYVTWHHDGLCYNGKNRLPEYDLFFE